MDANRNLWKDGLGWGFLLWLVGYVLGVALFMLVPTGMIGWIITPFASALTIWVLIRKITSTSLSYYLAIGVTWMVIAIVLDYFLIVQAFKPEDGYYKLDVYLYYGLTLVLPMIVGLWKRGRG